MNAEEILDTRQFSQGITELVKERTYGPSFLITGSQGFGKGYSRLTQYLLAQRIVDDLRNPLIQSCR